MSDFVPPYPERPRKPLSAFSTLRLARRNLLAIWEDRCFEWDFFSARVLSRMLFVCNSPDTVVRAFIERHESFERKSPQLRHGLAPLIGDGLFISDGEVMTIDFEPSDLQRSLRDAVTTWRWFAR